MLKILRFIISVLLLSSLGLWFLLHSNYVQKPLIERIAASLAKELNTEVQISHLSFSVPANINAHHVVFGNPASPWLTADELKMEFTWSDLWNQIDIPHVIKMTTATLFEKPLIAQAEIHLSGNLQDPIANIKFNTQNFAGLQGTSTLYYRNSSIMGHATIEANLPFLACNMECDFKWHLDTQNIELTLDSPQTSLNDIVIAGLHLNASVQNPFNNPKINLQFAADKIRMANATFEKIAAETSFDPTQSSNPFAITSSGYWHEPFAVHTDGHWALTPNGLQILSQTCQGTFANLPIALYDNSMLQIDISNSTTCTGRFSLSNYPPIEFTANMPLRLSLSPFAITLDHDAPIHGLLTGKAEITTLLKTLPDPPAISGPAQFQILLAGSLNHPQLTGQCDISDGTFEILKLGATLHHLTAHIEATPSQLLIQSISGNDDSGGTVIGTGTMQLDPEKKFPFTLNLQLAQTTLFNQDYATASFDGQLTLAGDTTAGKLSGVLQARTATFTIPEQSPALMNHVDVTFVNQPDHEPPPQAQSLASISARWPLTMDIALQFPENLTISGRDLNSTWKGAVTIQGTTKTPLLLGDIKVTDGQYLFNGKPFAINQGNIHFAGEINKKTSLYIIASKDLDQIGVDVILKGPLKNPSITFRSNPPLPQREILSWILFNRGSSEISPFQGSQLSESITNLDSKNQGPDILTKIRTSLGIDRLDFSRTGDGNEGQMSVQVGKYISDNVLVTVKKSDINSLAIEAAITNRIKLQAEVGDDAQGELLLKWKRDY